MTVAPSLSRSASGAALAIIRATARLPAPARPRRARCRARQVVEERGGECGPDPLRCRSSATTSAISAARHGPMRTQTPCATKSSPTYPSRARPRTPRAAGPARPTGRLRPDRGLEAEVRRVRRQPCEEKARSARRRRPVGRSGTSGRSSRSSSRTSGTNNTNDRTICLPDPTTCDLGCAGHDGRDRQAGGPRATDGSRQGDRTRRGCCASRWTSRRSGPRRPVDRAARDRAGPEQSGLIGHFGSKEELQLATIRAARAIFARSVIEPALEQPPGLAQVRALIDAWLTYSSDRRFPGGCFFARASHGYAARPVRSATRCRRGPGWLGLLEESVRAAQAVGEIAPDADAAQLTYELDACLDSANLRSLLGRPGVYEAGRTRGPRAARRRCRRTVRPAVLVTPARSLAGRGHQLRSTMSRTDGRLRPWGVPTTTAAPDRGEIEMAEVPVAQALPRRPDPHRAGCIPMDQWTPQEVRDHIAFMDHVSRHAPRARGEFVDAQALSPRVRSSGTTARVAPGDRRAVRGDQGPDRRLDGDRRRNRSSAPRGGRVPLLGTRRRRGGAAGSGSRCGRSSTSGPASSTDRGWLTVGGVADDRLEELVRDLTHGSWAPSSAAERTSRRPRTPSRRRWSRRYAAGQTRCPKTRRGGWSRSPGASWSTRAAPETARRARGARSPTSRRPGRPRDDTLLLFLCCHPRADPGLSRPLAAGRRRAHHPADRRSLPRAGADDGAADQPRQAHRRRRGVGPPGDLRAVLQVLYLVFSEGYTGDVDLAAEAIPTGCSPRRATSPRSAGCSP